ncbi:MAG: hypothetical protein NC826_04125, partial [Candidatus Omnitrophica bacterium]|nr:hypothetical protein [Candidatus Omnitrophota bacterium]
ETKKMRLYSAPEIDSLRDEFIAVMDDDFNTAKAMAVLFKLINIIEQSIVHYKENIQKIIYARSILRELVKILGITLDIEPLHDSVLEKIKLRNKLRENKKFSQADQIREELAKEGIILEDTSEGTIYRRKIL